MNYLAASELASAGYEISKSPNYGIVGHTKCLRMY